MPRFGSWWRRCWGSVLGAAPVEQLAELRQEALAPLLRRNALRARLESVPSAPSPNSWGKHPNAKWFTDFDAESRHEDTTNRARGSVYFASSCTRRVGSGRGSA